MNGNQVAGVLIILGLIVLAIICAAIIVVSSTGLAAGVYLGGLFALAGFVVATIGGGFIALFSHKASIAYFVIEAMVVLATLLFSHATIVLK